MRRAIIFSTLILLAAVSCRKVSETQVENHIVISQRGGKTIAYSPDSGVKILYDGGYAFKDLNRNGMIDPYEDWRRSSQERAADLASKMSVEEIAGLMLYSKHMAVPHVSSTDPMKYTFGGKSFAESGADTSALSDNQIVALKEDNLRHILVTKVSSPSAAARWNNNLQAFAESLPLGIPANNSSDPRNETRATDEFNEGSGGQASRWPTPLGLGASFDPEVVRDFGDVVSAEYRALGIATALSPQADIYTEPRWRRGVGTFTEDPDLAADMTRAYIDAFQTSYGDAVIEDGWGTQSVNCMVKHWPGGAAGEAGRDAHLCFGKYAVFPGGEFDTALQVFVKGAFNLDGPTRQASAVMPYYTISYGIDPSGKNVANSFSRYIIQDLLIDTYGYDGVICTDWTITGDYKDVHIHGGKPWGVETLSVAERHYEILKAGVDQFGGNNEKGPVLEAYRMWCEEFGEESARERFEHSARKLLMNFFRTGLFENPYLDPEETSAVLSSKDFRDRGYQAQLKSVVMLKNSGNVLPVQERAKVYMPKRQMPNTYNLAGKVTIPGRYDWPIDPAFFNDYYEFVENPADADFAVVVIGDPVNGRGYDVEDLRNGGNGYVPMSLQWSEYTADQARAVSLAGGDPKEKTTNRSYRGKTIRTENSADISLVAGTREAMGEKPVVVVLPCQKPVVMGEFESYADAILVSFGVEPQAYLDIISGRYEPSGLLPVQFPADMTTVELQCEDSPRDMKCYTDSEGNSYDFAFGMNWNGVIDDERVKKYR
ncbi:MAG: glycoside hydrolase family 3 protein [Bacteroidales bacterium]|nr:glycoside hydrolase family 3 protein [Bacteroidales bacterium]